MRADSQPLRYDGSQGRLQNQLFRVMMKDRTYDNHRGFLRKFQPFRLVAPKVVERVLRSYEAILRKGLQVWKSPTDFQKEAWTICGDTEHHELGSNSVDDQDIRYLKQTRKRSYRKILTILLLVEKPARIRSFIEEGICDADLPLVGMP